MGSPAPALLQGTEHSGVVVATFGGIDDMSDAFAVTQGNTMAHEAGHFFGLFHTTESPGANGGPGNVDPIPDTPECPASRDADGDGTVSAEECSDLDGGNLMFWVAPGPGSTVVQEAITPDQRFVFLRNPYVHD